MRPGDDLFWVQERKDQDAIDNAAANFIGNPLDAYKDAHSDDGEDPLLAELHEKGGLSPMNLSVGSGPHDNDDGQRIVLD